MWRTKHPREETPSQPQEAELRERFTAACADVDRAREQLEAVLRRRHDSAEARAAAHQLTTALQQATAIAAQALRGFQMSAPRHHLRPHQATREAPEQERWWGSKLVGLSDVSELLHQALRDDLELDVPTAVQVGSRAATGPHIAGMDAEPPDLVAATLHRPWIGVPLNTTIDRVTCCADTLDRTAPERHPARNVHDESSSPPYPSGADG